MFLKSTQLSGSAKKEILHQVLYHNGAFRRSYSLYSVLRMYKGSLSWSPQPLSQISEAGAQTQTSCPRTSLIFYGRQVFRYVLCHILLNARVLLFFLACFAITTIFSHAQTVVICASCGAVLAQPKGGKARLTEGVLLSRFIPTILQTYSCSQAAHTA